MKFEMPYNCNDYNLKALSRIYAEDRSNIIFWFGAGASASANLPTWTELRDFIFQQCFESLSAMTEEEAIEWENKLEIALRDGSYWQQFELAKKILGKNTFIDLISEKLSRNFDDVNEESIRLYNKAWSMRCRGAVTLNIDPLCERSHRGVRPTEMISAFSGVNAGDMYRYVGAMKPFIFYAHGRFDAPSSWIFTESDVSGLLADSAYIDLIKNIFQNYTVVFVGISATDVAAGGLLRAFTDKGIVIRTHYWVTPQSNADTMSLAKSLGIAPIIYRTDSCSHEEAICHILDFVRTYNSKEPPPPAIKTHLDPVPPPDSEKDFLIGNIDDKDSMRVRLASFMEHVMRENSYDTETAAYQSFSRTFKDSLRISWDAEVGETYFGYRVLKKIGGRNNSSVYEAVDADNNRYAIKILNMDKWRSPLYAASFRRGVESLRILNEQYMSITAGFVEAHEVPQALVMEYVDGHNLSDVVLAGGSVYSFWEDGINILSNICRELVSAHDLEQSVLHRDLRPGNIRLPNYYTSEGEERHAVCLLNFDLSWHKMAQGGVGLIDAEVSEFHAPEQIDDINGVAARSAKVDSYGLGMLIYYLYVGDAPPISGSKNREWEKFVNNSFRVQPKDEWSSASNRLARLVLRATQVEPGDRVTVRDIATEVEFLRYAMNNPLAVNRADCWAEEILCRAGYQKYVWEDNVSRAVYNLTGNREVSAQGDLRRGVVSVSFLNQGRDSTDRNAFSRMWKRKAEDARTLFESGGWKVLGQSGLHLGHIAFQVEMSVEQIVADVAKAVGSLKRAVSAVSLD